MTAQDTYDGRDDFFETFREKEFLCHPDKIKENVYDIQDIAHPLAYLCRYNGHVHTFYSVAEHCCHIHDFILKHYGTTAYDAWGGWTYKRCFQALMHDCSEAFISDMPAPMKRFMPDFKLVEAEIEKSVFKFYDLPLPDQFIKLLDIRILIDERAQAMNSSGKFKWFYEDDPSIKPLGITLNFWGPEEAYCEFMTRFHYIQPLYEEVKDDLRAQRRT